MQGPLWQTRLLQLQHFGKAGSAQPRQARLLWMYAGAADAQFTLLRRRRRRRRKRRRSQHPPRSESVALPICWLRFGFKLIKITWASLFNWKLLLTNSPIRSNLIRSGRGNATHVACGSGKNSFRYCVFHRIAVSQVQNYRSNRAWMFRKEIQPQIACSKGCTTWLRSPAKLSIANKMDYMLEINI